MSQNVLEMRVSIDLVTAARRNICFLRTIWASQLPNHIPTLLQAIRRYDELWMPLVSNVGSTSLVLLPPLDIQWVWFCHSLNPVSYRKYCESRFSKIFEKPAIFDDGNEEYALNRCKDVWCNRYPFEPFELDSLCDDSVEIVVNQDIYREVSKHGFLYSRFSQPYMLEMVYLISAKERYTGFLHLLRRLKTGYSRFVPTLDIQLMWLTHQSYPLIYAEDVKEIEGDLNKVVGVWDLVKDEDVEATKKMWEGMLDQPCEKAGATIDGLLSSIKSPVYWDIYEVDVNTNYKCMSPRFLLELCVFVRFNTDEATQHQKKNKNTDILRVGTVRCHKQLKIDTPTTTIPSNTWHKLFHLYCEFSTKGLILELRRRGGTCFKSSSRSTILFTWNDLLRAPNLTLSKDSTQDIRTVVSITPPAQAPYLMKCVPDRVTDDSGAMISDVILKMNGYRPQEGRWLSRTVLDHAGRECFVVRIRIASGFWRRGGEVPKVVKLEDRIIQVHAGSWSYVAGSIGRAPEKVVGTATPVEEEWREQKATWRMSTGDELTIQWTPSGPTFHLQNHTSQADEAKLLQGRRMQYHQVCSDIGENKEEEEEEEGFVTLVRYTPGNPNGRATALINWKLLVMEILPEEDAVMVLMLSIAILRSMSEMARKDVGRLLVRRRLKELQLGLRDWGSVILHPSSSSSICTSAHSPHLQPWYWNAKAVMASAEADDTRQSTFSYSPVEGGDKLYKQGILPSS